MFWNLMILILECHIRIIISIASSQHGKPFLLKGNFIHDCCYEGKGWHYNREVEHPWKVSHEGMWCEASESGRVRQHTRHGAPIIVLQRRIVLRDATVAFIQPRTVVRIPI